MSDYEPGTVAVATVRGVKGVRVMKTDGTGGGDTIWLSVGNIAHWRTHWAQDVADIRPLVVLDPENYDQIRGLVQDSSYLHPGAMTRPLVEAIQRALRKMVKPTRIPEPGLWGVVEAHINGQSGHPQSPYRWIREPAGWFAIASAQPVRVWDELIDPVLIREGLS